MGCFLVDVLGKSGRGCETGEKGMCREWDSDCC